MTDSDLDPDRILALSYVAAARRPALGALWRLDAAMGRVLAAGRDPMINRIKLAWWREALERLDRAPAPAEPLLQTLESTVLPMGLRGSELAELEQGWSILADAEPLGRDSLEAYAEARGGLLFRYSAHLLGAPDAGEAVAAAGRAWALVDLARHSAAGAEADAAVAEARSITGIGRFPARLRPLGMLAVLALRDAEPDRERWEPQGAPGRMLRMLRHRLTGA